MLISLCTCTRWHGRLISTRPLIGFWPTMYIVLVIDLHSFVCMYVCMYVCNFSNWVFRLALLILSSRFLLDRFCPCGASSKTYTGSWTTTTEARKPTSASCGRWWTTEPVGPLQKDRRHPRFRHQQWCRCRWARGRTDSFSSASASYRKESNL